MPFFVRHILHNPIDAFDTPEPRQDKGLGLADKLISTGFPARCYREGGMCHL